MENDHYHTSDQIYEIRVLGVIDERWSIWFNGFSLSFEEDGITKFIGKMEDNTTLYNLIGKIRDLGIPLLSIRRIYQKDDETNSLLNN